MLCSCKSGMTKMMVLVVLVASLHSASNTDKNKMFARKKERSNNGTITKNHNRFHCPRENSPDSNVHVCPLSKSLAEHTVGFQDCTTILSLSIRNVSIQICINLNRLLSSNASFLDVSDTIKAYPVFYEEVSSVTKSFFTGSVLVFETLFPFSGDLHMSKLNGKAVVFGIMFTLKCKEFTNTLKTFQVDACYECQAFCSYSPISYGPINIDKEFPMNVLPSGLIYQHHNHLRQSQIHKKTRLKRKLSNARSKLTCSLHVVSDHLFFKYVGDNDIVKTKNTMLELVNKVETIFKKSFNSEMGVDEVNFVVKYITVFRNERSRDYKLSGTYMTSDEYLKKFSLYDFSSVCLALGFTFRNFGGVVGTAFPAFSTPRMPGGICNERIKINSHYVSYNTVIMSFFSRGGELSQVKLALTLTHELGHSFGARHDETKECLPGENTGNYIMSSMVNSGEKPNNFLFSSCSIKDIMPVIMRKGKCLHKLDLAPFCGNAIPEEGEECDCGTSQQCEIVDPCCTPSDDKLHKPCTIRRHEGKLCSPRISSCCTSSCGYVPNDANKVCNSLNVCSQKSTCDGKDEHCPSSQPKPRGTPCHDGRHICEDHSCSGDVCSYYNLTTCQCNGQDNCKLCCRHDNYQPCRPVGRFGISFSQIPVFYQCASWRSKLVDTEAITANNGPIANYYDVNFMDIMPVPNSQKFRSWPFLPIGLVIIMICAIIKSASLHYEPNVRDDLKALRCGKLLAIFSIAEHQNQVSRRHMIEMHDAYCYEVERAQNRTQEYTEAIARLNVLFPHVPVNRISKLIKVCANESIAVRMLLTQGAIMQTFCKSLQMLKDAMRQVTIQYKNRDKKISFTDQCQ